MKHKIDPEKMATFEHKIILEISLCDNACLYAKVNVDGLKYEVMFDDKIIHSGDDIAEAIEEYNEI